VDLISKVISFHITIHVIAHLLRNLLSTLIVPEKLFRWSLQIPPTLTQVATCVAKHYTNVRTMNQCCHRELRA